MNDRELLELAAKAAGVQIATWSNCQAGGFQAQDSAQGRFWNPLTDDGDAFRLAVKCKLVMHFWDDDNAVSVAKTLPDGDDPDDTDGAWVSEPQDYRRAIVRAAAAIGAAL